MQTDDILILFAELSVALAGFTGVVGALDRRGFSRWPPMRRAYFANLLAASFLALFWSVLPLVASNAGVAPSRTWGLCSTIWALTMIPVNLMFWRQIRKHDVGIPLPAVAQTSALAIVVVLQLYNGIALQLSWPFLVAIGLSLGSGAMAFVMIVVSDPEDSA